MDQGIHRNSIPSATTYQGFRRWSRVVLTVLAVFIFLPKNSQAQSQIYPLEVILDSAREAMMNINIIGSANWAAEYMDRGGEDARAWALRGTAFKENKLWERAAADYKTALAKDPKVLNYFRTPIYCDLSEVYRAEERYEECMTVIDKGLSYFPESSRLYFELSFVEHRRKNWEKALEAVDSARAKSTSEILGTTYTNWGNTVKDSRLKDWMKNMPDSVTAASVLKYGQYLHGDTDAERIRAYIRFWADDKTKARIEEEIAEMEKQPKED